MAAVFQQKDNLWREFLNPLRGLTMERIVQLVELLASKTHPAAYCSLQRPDKPFAPCLAPPPR